MVNMLHRHLNKLFCIAMISILATGCGSAGGGASPTGPTPPIGPAISLEAPSTGVSTFTVAVKVDNVDDLFGAGFDLSYDTSIINITAVQDGGFLYNAMTPNWSESSNSAVIGVSSQASSGIAVGVDGDGTLCNITFAVLTTGSTEIKIVSGSAKFYDPNYPSSSPTAPSIGSSITITVM